MHSPATILKVLSIPWASKRTKRKGVASASETSVGLAAVQFELAGCLLSAVSNQLDATYCHSVHKVQLTLPAATLTYAMYFTNICCQLARCWQQLSSLVRIRLSICSTHATINPLSSKGNCSLHNSFRRSPLYLHCTWSSATLPAAHCVHSLEIVAR